MNRLVLLVVTAIALISAFIGLTHFPKRKLSLVDILPQETVAVVESKNITSAYRQVQQGLLGKALSRQDFPTFVRQFDVSTPQVVKLLAAVGAFNQLEHNEGVFSLLSRESIVALLPIHPGEQITLEQLQSRLVFLQHFSLDEDLDHRFSNCFGQIGQKNITEYQGQQLTRLTFAQGDSLAYFTHMGILVWAFEEKMLHPCVNQLLQQLVPIRAGIQKHVAYTRLKKHAGRQVNTFTYMRFNALQSFFGCKPHPEKDGQLPCPNDLALFSTTVAKGERLVVVALTDADKLAAYKKRNRLKNAVENAPLGRLSTNTTFALWTNWCKPDLLWERLQQVKFSPLQALVKGWSDDLSKASGVSISGFFKLFGNEFSFYIDQLRAPHQSPRSMASMAIEVRDNDQVAQLLQHLTGKLQVVEVLSGVGMKVVTLMLADGLLQPAYSLTAHHLILADNVELIERIHEKVNHPELRINPSKGLRSQRSNFFLFLRTGDMVEWLLPVLTTIGKEFGGHSRDDTEGWLPLQSLSLSLLADLREIETTKIRGYVGKEEMFLEVISSPVEK
ncbi:MAG: hypothetical protein PHI97_16025 [Desulfobulbus sp.]|nr:hypothetical protein [Desulfobulbus sp.]